MVSGYAYKLNWFVEHACIRGSLEKYSDAGTGSSYVDTLLPVGYEIRWVALEDYGGV